MFYVLFNKCNRLGNNLDNLLSRFLIPFFSSSFVFFSFFPHSARCFSTYPAFCQCSCFAFGITSQNCQQPVDVWLFLPVHGAVTRFFSTSYLFFVLWIGWLLDAISNVVYVSNDTQKCDALYFFRWHVAIFSFRSAPLDTLCAFLSDGEQQISSMGFKSNGKPGHIYHWNLPVLKKMLTKGESTGRKSSNLRHSNDVNDLIDIKNIPTWSNPWDDNNETLDKAFSGKQNRGSNAASTLNLNGIDDDLNLKLLKKKSPTYYAPAKQKKKATKYDSAAAKSSSSASSTFSSSASSSSSNKYFPGNGKPKSFYVMKKNAHKPYYQKLIP